MGIWQQQAVSQPNTQLFKSTERDSSLSTQSLFAPELQSHGQQLGCSEAELRMDREALSLLFTVVHQNLIKAVSPCYFITLPPANTTQEGATGPGCLQLRQARADFYQALLELDDLLLGGL